MKKLFLSFVILFASSTVLVSCADDEKRSDGSSDASKDATKEAAVPPAVEEKSICECMKMRKENPELRKPPVGSGCEWILSQTKDEYKTSMETAKRDCPELMR